MRDQQRHIATGIAALLLLIAVFAVVVFGYYFSDTLLKCIGVMIAAGFVIARAV